MAVKLGVNKGTINNYRQGRNAPNVPFVVSFCKELNFNYQWFIFGKGEPFPGAHEKYPEVCGPEEFQIFTPLRDAIKSGRYPPAGNSSPKIGAAAEFKISDAVTKAIRVLESGTAYATALFLNIEQFNRAVQSEQKIEELKEGQEKLEHKLSDLEKKMEAHDHPPKKEAM